MKSIKLQIVIVITLMFGLFLPVTSIASPVIYTYTGNYFSYIEDQNPPTGTYTEEDRIEITIITVDGLLSDMTFNWVPMDNIDSFTITDNRHSAITDDNPLFPYFRAEIVNGEITYYDVTRIYQIDTADGSQNLTFELANIYKSVEYASLGHWQTGLDRADAIPHGIWEVSTVPIPGAVWLLGSGLIGLVGIRKKMKK